MKEWEIVGRYFPGLSSWVELGRFAWFAEDCTRGEFLPDASV